MRDGHAARLRALRAELRRQNLDGFVVPLADEHLSEYVGDYAKRLAWLTAFTGSAGTAVILPDRAAIIVDGRYSLQVREEVDGNLWAFEASRTTPVGRWLAENAAPGAKIGFDPWLHTGLWRDDTSDALSPDGGLLMQVATNPVDSIWKGRPQPSDKPMFPHPIEFAGTSSTAKRQKIGRQIEALNADAVVLSALDSVAWTFNVRGADILHTPVALAYAVIERDGSADLFVDPGKVSTEVAMHLGDTVRVQPYNDFERYLRSMQGRRIVIDRARTVFAIEEALYAGGATIVSGVDPTLVPKAVKSDAEIAGHRAAQLRDCAALCRFLAWLAVQAPQGDVSELSAARELRRFREENPELRDLSFEAISGFGPNSAVMHYHPSPRTDKRLEAGSLYLIDSGGQYLDGTTDITRTVAIGVVDAEMRDRYTRVLKGHIALARATFPHDTCGVQLDILARQHLWAIGCDFAHGTGHGVGAYLSVHEGPQIIHRRLTANAPLLPGMILSNEPGYYKAGAYGIRIENLMLVTSLHLASAEQPMLGFETLSYAPLDRTLIDRALLTAGERGWVNSYHDDVRRRIAPQLNGEALDWLLDATKPLEDK